MRWPSGASHLRRQEKTGGSISPVAPQPAQSDAPQKRVHCILNLLPSPVGTGASEQSLVDSHFPGAARTVRIAEVGNYLFEEYASPPSDRPSGLALQDVGGQGLQFGRPVCGGHRWPQDEL